MAWPVLPHGFLGTQGVLTDEDTYQIERSLRFNSADAPRLTRTPSVSSNRKTFTISFWVKRSLINGVRQALFTANTAGPYFGIDFATTNVLNIYIGASLNFVTTQVFRDTTSWSHFVISVDTTQATGSDRLKIYHNGEQITSFTTATYPALNADLAINTASYPHDVGSWGTSALHLNGYMTEVYLIDGSALTPSSFGETDSNTGRWRAKAFSGTYGTNGFYLNFSDNSALTTASNVGIGKDFSGNSNYFATTNLSITAGVGNDSLIDTPTNYGNLTHTFSDDTYQIERSLRFNSADSAFLNRTPSSATSRTVWTFSCWVKRSALTSNHTIFSAGTSAVTRIAF
jgi:hypothetical protein